MTLTMEGKIGAWGVFYQNEDGTNPESAGYD
jgi:hypothetical protein